MCTKNFFVPFDCPKRTLVIRSEDMTDEERAFLRDPCAKNYEVLENSLARRLGKALL